MWFSTMKKRKIALQLFTCFYGNCRFLFITNSVCLYNNAVVRHAKTIVCTNNAFCTGCEALCMGCNEHCTGCKACCTGCKACCMILQRLLYGMQSLLYSSTKAIVQGEMTSARYFKGFCIG
jgi:hypothetical protein